MVHQGPLGKVYKGDLVLEPKAESLYLYLPLHIIQDGNDIQEYQKFQTPPCVACLFGKYQKSP